MPAASHRNLNDGNRGVSARVVSGARAQDDRGLARVFVRDGSVESYYIGDDKV